MNFIVKSENVVVKILSFLKISHFKLDAYLSKSTTGLKWQYTNYKYEFDEFSFKKYFENASDFV